MSSETNDKIKISFNLKESGKWYTNFETIVDNQSEDTIKTLHVTIDSTLIAKEYDAKDFLVEYEEGKQNPTTFKINDEGTTTFSISVNISPKSKVTFDGGINTVQQIKVSDLAASYDLEQKQTIPPVHSKGNIKLWISTPKVDMPREFMIADIKFNALMAFTGAPGLNTTNGSQPETSEWMVSSIPFDNDFDKNMEKYFSVPENFNSLDKSMFESDTKLWLNAYGGIASAVIGNKDLEWLMNDKVLKKLKLMGWDGISVDVENINLGTDPVTAANSIINLFTAIKKNKLLGAINTSTFGWTAALEANGWPGNLDKLRKFLKQLGTYSYDVWNPQLYAADGTSFNSCTTQGLSQNCTIAPYFANTNVIAPLIPANMGVSFKGADNPGSASGGWIFPGQGTSRNGKAGYGLWPEPSTVTGPSVSPPKVEHTCKYYLNNPES